MNSTNEYIFDVNTDQFEEKVLDASHSSVVVVDFWATWCAPCKMLGPILEKVVSSFDGDVRLAKVNVDENQELSWKYAVQSIPSIKIFKEGSVVDEFVGVRSENEISTILKNILGDKTDNVIAKAQKLIDENKYQEAESLFRSVLENQSNHSGALIGLARLSIKNENYDQARELLQRIDETEKNYEEAHKLLSYLKFRDSCEKSGDLEDLRKQFSENKENLEIGYNLGCCHASLNNYNEALETFLSILKKNSHYGDGKVKEAMLALFTILGEQSELTRDYRNRLAMVLF